MHSSYMRGRWNVTVVIHTHALELGTLTSDQYWQCGNMGSFFKITFFKYQIIAILKENCFVIHYFATLKRKKHVFSLLCIPFQGFVHMAEYFYLEVVIQFCTQIFSRNIITLNISLLLFKMFFEEIHFPRRQN